MERNHINERGAHTTVIEAARPILSFFKKIKELESIQVAPGKIASNVGAKSRSIKFKHINNEVYEMVVTHNGSRQEFKVITKISSDVLLESIQQDKKLKEWNINYTDMRNVNKVVDSKELNEKYKV
jgi:hypothetical protein